MSWIARSGLVIGTGLALGVGLFFVDSHESYRKNFDLVKIGMSSGEAAKFLRDSDGPFCGPAFESSDHDCWFRDDLRTYRVVFDQNTRDVTAKLSWRRKPRSVLDRAVKG